MTEDREQDDLLKAVKLGEFLQDSTNSILEKFGLKGLVSPLICVEVAKHFIRDMKKLAVIHQSKNSPENVRLAQLDPAKAAGYLAFWFRKLKPVSHCFPKHCLEKRYPKEKLWLQEDVSINETLTLYIAQQYLQGACRQGFFKKSHPDLVEERLEELFNQLFDSLAQPTQGQDASEDPTLYYDRMLYDMRFRTYGPHHFTSVLTQAIFSKLP